MNQGFKLRFDQMRDNNPANEPEGNGSHSDSHGLGFARNLCLIWPDGKRAFFNYAYLIASEFEPKDDKNLIRLDFSSYHVSLQGYSLEALFMAFLDHLPRLITAVDARYVLEEDMNRSIVIDMIVDRKGD